MDKGILQVNENSEAWWGRTAWAIISIGVGDLLISGSSEFIEYISFGWVGGIDVDSYGGNKETFPGMGIAKLGDSDSVCVILDSDNYADKINQIEIPNGRMEIIADVLRGENKRFGGRN